MKIAYVFATNMASTFKLSTMILPQLEKNMQNPKERMLFMVQTVMKMQISKLVFTLTLMKFLANY